jgi:hypothetical protein
MVAKLASAEIIVKFFKHLFLSLMIAFAGTHLKENISNKYANKKERLKGIRLKVEA